MWIGRRGQRRIAASRGQRRIAASARPDDGGIGIVDAIVVASSEHIAEHNSLAVVAQVRRGVSASASKQQ